MVQALDRSSGGGLQKLSACPAGFVCPAGSLGSSSPLRGGCGEEDLHTDDHASVRRPERDFVDLENLREVISEMILFVP